MPRDIKLADAVTTLNFASSSFQCGANYVRVNVFITAQASAQLQTSVDNFTWVDVATSATFPTNVSDADGDMYAPAQPGMFFRVNVTGNDGAVTVSVPFGYIG